jgi:PTS system nitrogen regulatory IIA component
MDIQEILSPQAVFGGVQAANKKKLIGELATLAADVSGLDAATLFETLWEREKLGSTGTGQGIAIPHARVAKLDRIIGMFVRLATPVPFESLDDAPVDLVFLLLTPADAGADHLKALARVSRLLRSQAMCEKLRATQDRATLYALLTEPSAGNQAA